MKVLELCMSPGLGGLELYAVRAATHLRARGVAVMAVGRASTLFAVRCAEAGVPLRTLPKASKLLPLLAARRLARLIDAERPDIVHMHWGPDLALAALAKRLARHPVRLVYTRQMLLTRHKRGVYHRFLYAQVDALVAITREVQDQARRYLPLAPDAVRLLYYGVPAAAPVSVARRAEIRAGLGLPADGFAVVLVGRIEAVKGQHLLVDAVERLNARGLRIAACLIGPAMDAGYEQALRARVARAGLAGQVVFHGPHRNPVEVLGAFDAAVLATRRETFGLVLPEAMRAGVAVIGTRAGGVPEIIDDGVTGLLFAPDDAAGLADALQGLAKDVDLRTRIAAAGKARADHDFSEERHYDDLIGFCNQVIVGAI